MFTDLPIPVLESYEKSSTNNLYTLSVGGGNNSFRVDKDGMWLGSSDWKNAPFRSDMAGNVRMNNADIRGTISGRSTDTIARVISQTGEIVTNKLNTDTGQILKEFTFAGYEGAFKSGNISWNKQTGNIDGGTGVVMMQNGIVGAKNGQTTFAINSNTGDATFGGTLTAPSGTLGTITAGTIYGANIFSPNIKTSESGMRVEINSNNKIQIFDKNGNEVSNYGYNTGQRNDNILWASIGNDGGAGPVIYTETSRNANTVRFRGYNNIVHSVLSAEAKSKQENALNIVGKSYFTGDIILSDGPNARMYIGYSNTYFRNSNGTLYWNNGGGERKVYHEGNLPSMDIPSHININSMNFAGYNVKLRAIRIDNEVFTFLTI